MKKLKSLVLVIAAVLFMPTIADAATKMPSAIDGVITLTEDVILEESYVVETGSTITLDLNGFLLTNVAGSAIDTIYVQNGANLKITGDGTITNTTKNYAALFNNGTVVIDGATLSRDSTNGNTYYVILNHGNMTIDSANVFVTGEGVSLIANGYYNYTSTNERLGYVEGVNEKTPTLTINNGTFDGGLNTVKNDDNGILVIYDGTFKNTQQVSLMNWNIATINGGIFETPTGNDKTNIFVGNYGSDSVDKGELTINGGTFNAEYVLEGSVVTPVKITDGTFNYTVGFINTDISKDDTLTNNGTNITGGTYATDSITPAEGYTKYSVGEDEYVVTQTITFDTTEETITLTEGETKTIDVPDVIKTIWCFRIK